MTPITSPHVFTAAQLALRDTRASLAAAFMLITWGYVAHVVAADPIKQEPVADNSAYKMLKASCKFPSNPGEATTYALTADRKMYCWEMGRK